MNITLIAVLWLGAIGVACRWAGMGWMRTLCTALLMPLVQVMGFYMLSGVLWFVAGVALLLIPISVEFSGATELMLFRVGGIIAAIPILWFTGKHFSDERDTIRHSGSNGLRGGSMTLGIHQHEMHASVRYHGSTKDVKTPR